MLTANGGLMVNNEQTSQWNPRQKPECRYNDNKRDACPSACRKHKLEYEALAEKGNC